LGRWDEEKKVPGSNQVKLPAGLLQMRLIFGVAQWLVRLGLLFLCFEIKEKRKENKIKIP
jgi:hypothetical protein